MLEEDAVKNDEVFESDAENDDEKYFVAAGRRILASWCSFEGV